MEKEELLAEWKKHDPFLSDPEGFQRFLDAHELKRLIRLGHPNSHGEPYSRFQIMHKITERGKAILSDLRWPDKDTSKYANRYTGGVETLKEILDSKDDGLNPMRTEMHLLEEKINKLTNGKFYGDFTGVGLECTKVSTIKKIVKDQASPELEKTVHRCVLLHKGFYERLHTQYSKSPILLTDEFLKNDSCVQNIIAQCRWLGIDVDEITPDEDLPLRKWTWYWSLMESWDPAEETLHV